MTAAEQRPFLDFPRDRIAFISWTNGGQNLLVAMAYVLTGYAGLRLAFVGESVTLFWPPTGIAFAAMWMGGRRLLSGVALGAFLVNLVTIKAPGLASIVAVGNTLPALSAVYILRRMIGRYPQWGESPRVVCFILIGALGCTILSATVGTFAVDLFGHIGHAFLSTWFTWWMGDAMGVLIVAPPLLLWRRFLSASGGHRIVEALAFVAAGVAIITGLDLIRGPVWAVELCKLFTLLLSLLAGARFGLAGPAAITPLMAAGTVGVTVLGRGPFMRGNFYDSFALVHSFLFTEAAAGMLLAAALSDLQQALMRERRALHEVELASANRVRLLAMISHDVRTPLSGMMGVLQTLHTSALPAAQTRLVGLGLRAGETITKLVTDILDVARADSGRITLDLAAFSPAGSLQDVMTFSRAAADARKLSLSLDLDPTLPELVVGDHVRFGQLVGNLVNNAVAYTETGGVCVITTWQAAHERLEIKVIDTGPGIESGLGDHIFDAFVAPRPGNRSAGLGLGLHICQRLTELMGGRISYARGADGGSVFAVELPLPVLAALPSPASQPTAAEPGLNILLVEDDDITREVTAALLTSKGHVTTAVGTGEDALAHLREGRVDLILLDVQLQPGGLSGLETVAAIRALPGPLGESVIVALTGDSMKASHHDYLSAGMDGVLVKPLRLDGGLGDLIARARQRAAGIAR